MAVDFSGRKRERCVLEHGAVTDLLTVLPWECPFPGMAEREECGKQISVMFLAVFPGLFHRSGSAKVWLCLGVDSLNPRLSMYQV